MQFVSHKAEGAKTGLTHPSSMNHPTVILNLFQDNARPLFVILKQVQDDDGFISR